MACCAFAVFLLGQLLLPFRRVSAALFGEPARRRNSSVLWSLAAPAVEVTTSKATKRRWTRRLAVLALVEALMMTGAVSAGVFAPEPVSDGWAAIHLPICRGLGIAD